MSFENIEIVNIEEFREANEERVRKNRGKILGFLYPVYFEYWKEKYSIGLNIDGILFWSAKHISRSFNSKESVQIFNYVVDNQDSLCSGFVNECKQSLNDVPQEDSE